MQEGRRKTRLMVVMGTRPEVIKLAPIVLGARSRSDEFETIVVSTSQHREMLDQMLEAFQIDADVDLDIMKPDQGLVRVTTAALEGLDDAIGEHGPDWVVVQGDTTTTLTGALAAFYRKVRVAHVEAGLRTYDKHQPFPEEINRRLTTQLADLHFAPTERSRDNLLREGVDPSALLVTGNTGIDALFHMLEESGMSPTLPRGEPRRLLVTAHRRENHGAPMEGICRAILRLVEAHPGLGVRFPVHMSPRVRGVVMPMLGDQDRIDLCEPLDYSEFVRAMADTDIILTDSGGVQEEAPSLGKPVLVMRETTERPEGVDAGTVRLVGADEERIFEEVSTLIRDTEVYRSMALARNPYGDGHATHRILDALRASWLRDHESGE